MIKQHNATVIVSSYPNKDTATTIAETLIKNNLAACVQIGSAITSVYIWEESLEKTEEVQVHIKTIESNIEAIQTLILTTHPYDTPEIITIPITQIDERYYQWLNTQSAQN